MLWPHCVPPLPAECCGRLEPTRTRWFQVHIPHLVATPPSERWKTSACDGVAGRTAPVVGDAPHARRGPRVVSVSTAVSRVAAGLPLSRRRLLRAACRTACLHSLLLVRCCRTRARTRTRSRRPARNDDTRRTDERTNYVDQEAGRACLLREDARAKLRRETLQ